MAVSARKARAPIESVIVSPINESVTFGPNNTIIYRIGADDLSYLLPQDSYFTMDCEFISTAQTKPNQDLIIRASPMFFDNVRVIHAGNEVYYSQYSIAQQFLDYVKTGSDLDRDYYQYTSHNTYQTLLDNPLLSTPLVIKASEWQGTANNFTCEKKGTIVRLGQRKTKATCPVGSNLRELHELQEKEKENRLCCEEENDEFCCNFLAELYNNFMEE